MSGATARSEHADNDEYPPPTSADFHKLAGVVADMLGNCAKSASDALRIAGHALSVADMRIAALRKAGDQMFANWDCDCNTAHPSGHVVSRCPARFWWELTNA